MNDGIARRLRAARGYGKLSQPALAQELEISEGTVKNIELGKRAPKRSELLAIAEACSVPMWFLERGWNGWQETTAAGDVDAEGKAALRDLDRRSPSKRTA
jgi:transcriptional regulator with XRE-family HTH domain